MNSDFITRNKNDRRRTLAAVKMQIIIGTAVSIALGISLGLYISSQIIGNYQ